MRTIRILLAFLALAIPVTLFGQVSVSISVGPPALPSTTSQFARETAIFGLLATGHMTTASPTTTGWTGSG